MKARTPYEAFKAGIPNSRTRTLTQKGGKKPSRRILTSERLDVR